MDRICKNCVSWLITDRIKDYGFCVKRDAYKPEHLTCDHFRPRSEFLVQKGVAKGKRLMMEDEDDCNE